MLKIFRGLISATALALCANIASAESITIAAASDLKFALADIANKFNAEHPGDEVKVVYGSSGKFSAQIQNGAPFDMLFSADAQYPEMLKTEGLAGSDPVVYAIGRIVIWSSTTDASKLTLQRLADADIHKIAIASPDHAPYGQRAKEALQAARVWEKIQGKLVFGENIAHTAQMASSGAADTGIIALSLALNPELSTQGGYALIAERLHAPLVQAFVITKRAQGNALAQRFAAYMQVPAARSIMERYGFMLPKK